MESSAKEEEKYKCMKRKQIVTEKKHRKLQELPLLSENKELTEKGANTGNRIKVKENNSKCIDADMNGI